MKIYTRTGDAGQTGLIGGARVDKDHARVETYGCVDELNAAVGWALAACDRGTIAAELRQIQDDLFRIGAELATDDDRAPPQRLDPAAATRLEQWLDRAWNPLPELRNFILPGGSEPAARLHVARTVCRRAERAVVSLARVHSVGPHLVVYLNRLSDLLFAYARLANHLAGVLDIPWLP